MNGLENTGYDCRLTPVEIVYVQDDPLKLPRLVEELTKGTEVLVGQCDQSEIGLVAGLVKNMVEAVFQKVGAVKLLNGVLRIRLRRFCGLAGGLGCKQLCSELANPS